MTKMTYTTALNTVLDNCELTDEVREKLVALREQLAKRNSGEKKPTKVQQENENTKQVVLDVLAENGGLMTVSQLQSANETLAAMSNQKVSALVRQLVADGKIERVEDKRKAFFKVA